MGAQQLNIIDVILLMLFFLFLQGCTTSAEKTVGMRKMMELNRHDLALIEAEKHLANASDGVMENMNVGLLRRLNKKYKESNQAFSIAKEKINLLYSRSVSEQASAFISNDENISFRGYKFEQVLIHFYMALNFISMNDLDSARVELLQSQVKMDEWGEPKDEVPFMRYFSGILFEMLGEDDSATVSYRKAVDAYRNTKDKHGVNVPLILKHDLLRMLAVLNLWNEYEKYKKQFAFAKYETPDVTGKGELIVIFGNGIAPQREQIIFQTFSYALSLNVRVAIPDYPNPPGVLKKVRLHINDKYYPLEVVSNIDGLARSSLAEDMPAITARAIARAVVKKKSEMAAGKESGVLGQLAVLVINHNTEIADTRSWNTLPQEFELARVFLPQGEYNIEIEVVGRMGNVVDTIKSKVKINAGKKTIVSKRWTSPDTKLVPLHKAQVILQ